MKISWFKNNLVIIIILPWLIIGIVLLCTNWLWDWIVIQAIATWVLAAGIGVAIWQIIITGRSNRQQLEASRRSTNAHVALEISRELRSGDNLNLLREVYSYKPEHLEGKIPKDRMNSVELIINRLGMIGALVIEDIIDEGLVISTIAGTTSLRCWYQLHKYVKETRKQRGYFGEHFEDLAKRSLEFFISSGSQVLFSVEGDEDSVDLVAELQKDELCPKKLE